MLDYAYIAMHIFRIQDVVYKNNFSLIMKC
jgi:hypothetical protein